MTMLLQPLKLPHVGGRMAHGFLTDAGKFLLALRHNFDLHIFRYAGEFAPVCRFALPQVFETYHALSPNASRLVGVTSKGICQIEAEERGGGHRQVYIFEDAEEAQVKAAQFSASGRVLWVSRERWTGAPANDPLNAWHELIAFDSETLTPLGRVPITGEADGAHDIQCHPLHDIAGVDVSCGQDGSWLSFAHVEKGRLERRGELVARPNDPFACAGFAPDGSALMIIDEGTACELAWPGAGVTAQVTADAADAEEDTNPFLFKWSGAYIGGHFVASVFREGEDRYILRAFACPGLRDAVDLRLSAAANQEVWRLSRLGADVLLAQYKQRLIAWRVIDVNAWQPVLF